ncbi:uncharacterized protein LOC129894652 [Solanum dulcamara]|uniref:uncharacterized protein LOC129894652 n=1 Tax=Solanum dulcamara TaxID=45834 RepID=UPI002485487A|nr:uncharacterized protein LOC129894652 [Solanum dulcamara]
MIYFSNVFAYCQYLKSLAYQLKNVGSPVANDRLVLQLVSVLIEPYQGVNTLIHQCDPLSQLYQARSMLTLEEASHAKKVSQSSFAALVARSPEGPPDVPDNSSSNRNSNGGKEAASSGGNIGRGGQLGGGNSRGTGQQSVGQNPPPYSPWDGRQQWPWMASWGVLGPRPQQAYTAAPPPTNIEATMHSLGITSPNDFQMGRLIMRYNSPGELYPITNSVTSPSTFAALAQSLWHVRLGHPGAPVLNSLRKNKLIDYREQVRASQNELKVGDQTCARAV